MKISKINKNIFERERERKKEVPQEHQAVQ